MRRWLFFLPLVVLAVLGLAEWAVREYLVETERCRSRTASVTLESFDGGEPGMSVGCDRRARFSPSAEYDSERDVLEVVLTRRLAERARRGVRITLTEFDGEARPLRVVGDALALFSEVDLAEKYRFSDETVVRLEEPTLVGSRLIVPLEDRELGERSQVHVQLP